MERRRVGTGSRWEEKYGYARAVRVGDHAWTAGTLAVGEDGEILHPRSAYAQARAALETLEGALGRLGMGRADVVRVRYYVRNMEDEEEVGRAHAEFFGDVHPAVTMVEVSGLASPEARVEVELEAFASGEDG